VTSLVATENLAWLISGLGGMPQDVGYAAASFLKSPAGVYSALHLGTDEMVMIQRDKWDETVWGQSSEGTDCKGTTTPVPLRFYFGRQVSWFNHCERQQNLHVKSQDVWVWDDARDELISSRGRSNEQSSDPWKPLMIVDEDNVPHGFIVREFSGPTSDGPAN
jgi:Lipid-droplet associated hydrolase